MGRRNQYRSKGGDALQVTLCDPYLSALEAFAWTRYTNRHLLTFTLHLPTKLEGADSFALYAILTLMLMGLLNLVVAVGATIGGYGVQTSTNLDGLSQVVTLLFDE